MALDRSGARGTTDGLRRDRVRGVPLNGHAISGVPGRFMGFVTAAPTTFEGYLPNDCVVNSVSGHFYVLIAFGGGLIWIDGTNTAVIPEANVTGLVADLAKKANFTVCTSGTRPGSPAIGDEIFETDTGNNLRWYGTTPAWYPAVWDAAWGNIAEAKLTAAQNTISTIVDITSLTVTFTAIANRKYLVSMLLPLVNQITSAGTVTPEIQTLASGAGTRLQAAQISLAAAGVSNVGLYAPLQTPAAGSTSYHGRIATSAGTVNIASSATVPSIIRVDDIGPNGAPS